MTYPHTNKKMGKSKIFVVLAVISSLGVLFLLRSTVLNNLLALFNPVSIVASVSTPRLNQTDGRTNILILGSDKRSSGDLQGSSILTDTILVASIGNVDNDVVLISIPRDLWVKWPSTGGYSKINAVYAGVNINNQDYGGIEELSKIIENTLGIKIHYYGMVSFDLFENAIDTLGGVNVNVDKAFTDYYYPIEGKENAPKNERYETVSFKEGIQTMDGKTALKFVRSRKGDNNEGTDFARSKRQQKVIMALKEKVLSLETLVNPAKIKELYDLYAANVDTNIDILTVQNFYLLSQKLEFDNIISVVLDDRSTEDEGGLLYSPEDTTLYRGQYVLIPKTGDYSQIRAFVQKYLYANR